LDYDRLLHEAGASRNPKEAKAKLAQAIELDPKKDFAHSHLVRLLEGEEQRRALDAWSDASPDSFDAQLQRATRLLEAGAPEAEPALRRVADRWPEAFEPLLHLARVAVTAGRREEALELLRASREKHAVGDGEYDFESEVEQYEEVVELLPELER
jgi:thioredoxin-like negative regulator of GroEL